MDACGEAQRKSLLNILHTAVEGAEFTVKESEATYDALETALEDVENTEVTSQQARQVKTRQRCGEHVCSRVDCWLPGPGLLPCACVASCMSTSITTTSSLVGLHVLNWGGGRCHFGRDAAASSGG